MAALVCAHSCGSSSAFADGSRVRIWDTHKRTVKHEMSVAGVVTCISFAPREGSGSLLAAGSSVGAVVLHDCARGERYATLESQTQSSVTCLCWSESGDSSVFAGYANGQVIQWDVQTKAQVISLKGDSCAVSSLRVSPCGRYLLIGSRVIRLWNLKKQKSTKKFAGHTNQVKQLCCVEQEEEGSFLFLSLAEEDRAILLWNRKQTAPIATFTCIDNVMSFDAVRGTNGGALTVAAACYDGSVRGFVHGEEGEGQEGGARVPQWSLQFLEQDKGSPLPISILGVRLDKEAVFVAYGSSLQPVFEILPLPPEEPHCILLREVSSNLLLPKTVTGQNKVAKGEKKAAVQVSGPTPKRQTVTETEATFEDLLSGPLEKKPKLQQEAPSTESLSQLIVQAVHSKDSKLLESAIQAQAKEKQIKATIDKLPASIVAAFITQLVERIEARPARCAELLVWIRTCLTSHVAYLSTVPMATKALGYLEDLANIRLAAHERVCKLHGKLEMLLAQIASRATEAATEVTPLLVHEIEVDDASLEGEESATDRSEASETDQSSYSTDSD